MYKIFATDAYSKDIKEVSKNYKILEKKLKEYIYPQLKENPYYGKNIKKLAGYKPDTWRYRIARWRIFYEIDEKEKVVYLIAVYARQSAYRS